jgi:PAS domain-containing protein
MAIPDSSSRPDPAPAPQAAGVVMPARAGSISDALDSLTDSVQLIDANWRTVYLNKAARRTLREQGTDPDQVIGRHFWDEIYAETRGTPLQRAYINAMEARQVTELENYYPPWQRWFWVRATTSRTASAPISCCASRRKSCR